ncbi:hypothetical protein EJ08DRAFT_410668 [Tothia fuscella]|uniref:Uncharacterized protein n=1 Tax=Tothia fuscella TaxID=1048955 RepID=A0A9P4NJR7_9PEZI|nr:hypothetical protein EJ08DRAFT_410668 [Tothia fuscella]
MGVKSLMFSAILIAGFFVMFIISSPINGTLIHELERHHENIATSNIKRRAENLPLCTYIPTLCASSKYRDCETPLATVNTCYDLSPSLNDKLSSIKIPEPLVCNLYDLPGCERKSRTEDYDVLTFYAGSDRDLRGVFNARAWNDRVSSMRCKIDGGKQDEMPGYCSSG